MLYNSLHCPVVPDRVRDFNASIQSIGFTVSSIGVGGTRAFFENALIPTQLHTTFHIMASYFWSRIFDLVFLISYFENLYVI